MSATIAHGWKRTLPAALSPLLSDGPIAVLMLLVLTQVPAGFERVLRVGGGVLLIYLALGAYRDWRRREQPSSVPSEREPRTLLQAAAVNILNPNPYLGWSLILGPLVLRAWRLGAGAAVGVVASFYGTIVVLLAVTIVLFGTVRRLGATVTRALLLLSAVTLLVLGVYQLVMGFAGLS